MDFQIDFKGFFIQTPTLKSPIPTTKQSRWNRSVGLNWVYGESNAFGDGGQCPPYKNYLSLHQVHKSQKVLPFRMNNFV